MQNGHFSVHKLHFVSLIALPQLMTQYSISCKDFPPSPSERTQPKTLKRGTENIPVEIPEGKCSSLKLYLKS